MNIFSGILLKEEMISKSREASEDPGVKIELIIFLIKNRFKPTLFTYIHIFRGDHKI